MTGAYTITVAELRQIVAESGLEHAELCVEQMETQDGSEAAAPLKAELARLIDKAAAEQEASLPDSDA